MNVLEMLSRARKQKQKMVVFGERALVETKSCFLFEMYVIQEIYTTAIIITVAHL